MNTDVPIRAGGWIDQVFDLCVQLLLFMAKHLGMTYTEINIWIFCIIWPLLTLVLVVYVVILLKRNRALKRQLLSP